MQAGIENVINAKKFLHKIGINTIDNWIKEKSSAETFKSLIEMML